MKEISLKVNGMVCGGCEKRVQNVLKNIEGVEEAIANYNENIVKIILNENVFIDELKNTINDIGFEVVE